MSNAELRAYQQYLRRQGLDPVAVRAGISSWSVLAIVVACMLVIGVGIYVVRLGSDQSVASTSEANISAPVAANNVAATVPTITPPPEPPAPPYTPLPGSWVAYAPSMAVRFYALPEWEEKPEYSSTSHLSLGSASNTNDFEAFDLYRFRGVAGASRVSTWRSEYEAYMQDATRSDAVLTSAPRPQKAAGYDGSIGQFHYDQASDGLQIDVTLWIGQVQGDEVALIFRCEPSRDVNLDQAVEQVLATIDFNAN